MKLIGFDSMGTRGMATVVHTPSLKILVDPGVSVAPRRFGLPPHPVELAVMNKTLESIRREAADSDIVIISHYHRDHYLYRMGEEEYYRGKILFIKHPGEMINRSQAIRSYILLKKMGVESIASRVEYADGTEHVIDKNCRLTFSDPFPHGPDGTRLGYVLITTIDIDGYRVMHASDVQGPISDSTRDYIISMRPDILVISGPPTYFEGFKMEPELIGKGLINLRIIASSLRPGSLLIVDHHLLRDINYRARISGVLEEAALHDVKVLTAAEYMGKEPVLLEARRRELWRRSQL